MKGAQTQPVSAAGGAARQAAGLPRLLPHGQPHAPVRSQAQSHAAQPVIYRGSALIEAIAQSGLTGRGGAAFPVHRKLAAARRCTMVIANGAESEPASRKDATLLRYSPHLVRDGLHLVAEAVGASQVRVYTHDDRAGFLAGQETAAVNRVTGGPARPTFAPPRPTELGYLIHNVETLAHIAVIARYGPAWFRAAGTRDEPGTMLTTIRTADGTAVREAELGTPLRDLVDLGDAQAVLIGGYHGTWLPAGLARDLTLDNATLRPHGASLGAGVIAVLPGSLCGLRETTRVTRYLAAESAGQCGPCLNGLPRIANALQELSLPELSLPELSLAEQAGGTGDILRWLDLVTGRGACHHPDGTARFVRSALDVFAAEIRLHARGRCSATSRHPFLPTGGET
jgi:NADH:ubiquinone oxidoreductase subunit F (NADH-binding)